MIFAELFVLTVTLFVLCFFVLSFYIEIKGAPFVPTSSKIIYQMLLEAQLKKGTIFYELGCGDGRVLFAAAKHFGQKGLGVDIHPWLIWYCLLMTKLKGLKHISFIRGDVLETDLSPANVIYVFMGSRMNKKLAPLILKQCKKGTQIISRGFIVPGFDKYLYKTIQDKYFPVYYYKLK